MILNSDGSYGGSLDEAKYGKGAPLNGEYDVKDSPYYVVDNDYYNLPSTDQRAVFTHFSPYQKTMQDSDGIACLMMILNYVGEDVRDQYSELALVERYEALNGAAVYGNGTTAAGLKALVADLGLGWKTENAPAFSKPSSDETREQMKAFFKGAIADGKFVLVRYQSPNGSGWKIVIGYDSFCSVESTLTGETIEPFADDAIILADPNDCSDHLQDGYVVERAQAFLMWWRNLALDGTLLNSFSCLVIDPGNTPAPVVAPVETGVSQARYENHLPLNPDGSYGGTRDAELYGEIHHGSGRYDHPESAYYKVNDFYNMGSSGSRIMLPHYTVLQQTMRSSCGCCAVTSVMKYYGTNDDSHYDLELSYTEAYESLIKTTIYGVGTGVPSHKKVLESMGYHIAEISYSTAGTLPKYSTYQSFLAMVKFHLSEGRPIVALTNFAGGHFLTIIGVDDMGTDCIYDDVIITADSADCWDGCQDGYTLYSAYRFFLQFTNGNYKQLQSFLVIEKDD